MSDPPDSVRCPLFGDALSICLPSRFVDVSQWRQVPDHQEVLADADSDQSVVVECNLRLQCADSDAAAEHIEELAAASSSSAVRILSQVPLPASSLPSLLRPASFASLLTADMLVSKYRDDSSLANTVRVRLLLLRLREEDTDLLVVLNTPLRWAEGGAVDAASRRVVSEEETQRVMQQIMDTLSIHDYSLFSQSGG
jgi:hypothetical protein